MLKIGQVVSVTNGYGINIGEKTIIGVSSEGRYYLTPTDTPWYSWPEERLKVIGSPQGYYFEIEKLETNAVTFAYIFRAGESARTNPPEKEFHSIRFGDKAKCSVAKKAVKWINSHGVLCEQ